MSENLSSISFRKGLNNNLFENIQDAVCIEDSVVKLKELSKEYSIGEAHILGTSSFYDFLKEENIAKKVHICNGSACLVSRKQDKLKESLLKNFSDSEIGHVACVGRCHENSAFLFNNKTYSATNSEDIQAIIAGDYHNEEKFIVDSNLENPILISRIPDVEEFYSLFEKFNDRKQNIIEELKKSNLRGRGGAGFPYHIKLNSCNEAKSEIKYIVCNADEGDPGAYSDKYLLEYQPHKVLFGMMISGYCVGANDGVLYIRAEYPEAIEKTQKAIDEFEKLNISNFKFKIIKGAGAYICGEETSLLNSIEGQRAEVRTRPPYPTIEGLYGKPTVLSNVETFANIHWILENSGEEYAKLGTDKSKGSKLISLDGNFNKSSIYEIEMGSPVNKIFECFGGDFKTEIKAFQIGGPLGGIVPYNFIKDLTLDYESFGSNGFLLGHASFVSIPQTFPFIEYIKHLFEFTANESCGKCYPCRIGSVRGLEMLKNAIEGNKKIDKSLLEDLLETMELGSLCALGGGLPLPIKNVLKYFPEELAEYLI